LDGVALCRDSVATHEHLLTHYEILDFEKHTVKRQLDIPIGDN